MTSKNFTVKHRRKREQKTNYKKRFKFLSSGLPRLVVRLSTTNINVQLYEYQEPGDKVLAAVNSRDLVAFGWKYSGSSIPAAYLAGYLCGVKAQKLGLKEIIVDLGKARVLPGSRLYAAVKGAKDAGLNVKCGDKVLPDEKVCKGERIVAYAKLLLDSDKARYEKQFSGYVKNSVKPEDMDKVFAQVKEAMDKKWRS